MLLCLKVVFIICRKHANASMDTVKLPQARRQIDLTPIKRHHRSNASSIEIKVGVELIDYQPLYRKYQMRQ